MGTQTSKPLFGDEERRKLGGRRPHTPTNNANTSYTTGDDNCNKNAWPCANCHATVSSQETKCPYCGGIQVSIPQSPPSMVRAMNAKTLLERLAPTPTTPKIRKEMEASKLQAFLSETATTSTMDYDEDEEEYFGMVEPSKAEPKGNEFSARPSSSTSSAPLSDHNSSQQQQQQQRPLSRQSLPSPPIFAPSPVPSSIDSDQITAVTGNRKYQKPFYSNSTSAEAEESRDRPPDPVALTLEAAQLRSGTPSPQVVYDEQKKASLLAQSSSFFNRQEQPATIVTTDTNGDNTNATIHATAGTPKRKATTEEAESPKKKIMVSPSSTSV